MGSEIKDVQVFAENTDRENAIELPGEIVKQVFVQPGLPTPVFLDYLSI